VNILDRPEYEFIKADNHLGDRVILLTFGGSYSYGTNKPDSDIDIRGITIELTSDLLGLTNFEQKEDNITDTVVYALRKAVKLMMDCNPNVIEMLGCKNEHYLILTQEGRLLRENVNLFLSQKAKYTFGGYATAQLRRLQNALARDVYAQPQKEEHILGSIKRQMATLEGRYAEFGLGKFNMYIDKSEKEGYDTEIFMDIDLEHYPLRDFKNIYSEINNILTDYGKLNYRNRKKTEEGLFKHAMHLIRLLITGAEVLEGKGITTYREKEHNLLMDIRDGIYTYDQIFEIIDEYDKRFQYASDNSPLPKKPEFNKINELVIEVNRSFI
jgi:predicted nucleotidyltransferase